MSLNESAIKQSGGAACAHARAQSDDAGRCGGTRKLPREAQARLVPGRSRPHEEVGHLLLDLERAREASGDRRADPGFVGGRTGDYELATFNLEDLGQGLHTIARNLLLA